MSPDLRGNRIDTGFDGEVGAVAEEYGFVALFHVVTAVLTGSLGRELFLLTEQRLQAVPNC